MEWVTYMITLNEFKKNYNVFSYLEKNNKCENNIIFLHGLSNNKYYYYSLIETIDNYNCYALDYRSHGKSTSKGDYSLDSFSDDILSFINYLGLLDNYYIVASSLSCWVVSNLDGKINPKGLIFLDGGYYSPSKLPSNTVESIRLPIFKSLEEVNDLILEDINSLKEEEILLSKNEIQNIYNSLISTYKPVENSNGAYSYIISDNSFNGLVNDLNTRNINILNNDNLILLLSDSKNNDRKNNSFLQKELKSNANKFHEIQTISNSDHLMMLTSITEVNEVIQTFF